MKHFILLIFVFFLGHFLATAQSSDEIVKTLELAIKQRNPETVKPLLSPTFRVHVSGLPSSYQMLENALKSYKTLRKLEYVGETKTETESSIRIKCFFKDAKEFESVISLDSSGKISRIRYVDQLYGLFLEKESKLVATIPFVFRNGKIMVKLKINDSDKELNMLFDTGADGVGMKKEIADAIGLVETRKQETSVVGASLQVTISSGNTLKFDSLQLKNQNIAIFPSNSDDLDGLFGANFLRNYITNIDFDQSVIKLFSFGEITYPEGGTFVPLDYQTGLPGIDARFKLNSGKEMNGIFHFDTGAGYPLIFFSPFVTANELEKDFKVQSNGVNFSLGHQTTTVQGIVDNLQIGSFSIPHFSGTLQQSSGGGKAWTTESSGSLGIDIISKFNCWINVLDNKFYLIPNRSFKKPLDFWIGPVMFGLKNDNLVVKQMIPGTLTEPEMRLKDGVSSINDRELKDLDDIATIIQLEKEFEAGGAELIINRNDLEFKVSLSKR